MEKKRGVGRAGGAALEKNEEAGRAGGAALSTWLCMWLYAWLFEGSRHESGHCRRALVAYDDDGGC